MSASPPVARRGRFGARLASDSVVYGLGGMANQAVAILLVPIYARQLGAEGVGIAGVLNSTISLSLMFVGLALPQAFFRWYLREATTERDQARVLGTILAVRLAASLGGFALVLAGSIPIAAALYGGEHLLVFALAAPIVLFDSFNAIPLSFLRAERKPRDYVAISISRAVLGTVLILSFVVAARMGVVGVALGGAIAAAISALIGTWAMARAGVLRLSFDRPLARAMLSFALPLVPAAMAGWVLNLSDRPLLQAMTGDRGLVGVYTMGYTAGLVINALAIQPFTLAWGAAYWEVSRGDDAPRVFARALTWFLAIAAGVALFLSGMGTDALRLLVGPQFEESRYIIPFSAFSYVLYGAYTVGASGLSVVGRSGMVATTMAIAAVATLVLNLALIPIIGMYGAAISTVSGYLLLAIVAGAVSQRYYPVDWELGRAISILLIAVALSAAALLGPDHVLWRIGCVVAYVPILLGLGIVKISQGRLLLSALRR
ncbi:MAG TPA: polysaccharide biosynthesis C-terminal domain-containing protein [Candidatus Limnocylindria bacterium]|nr:polysaccharide biosynthesis C-terminal domain-containing protein [Candidatus Limnocylindria bacterium]